MKFTNKFGQVLPGEKRKSGHQPWYALDNAANLFPAISNDRNTNVFRMSCELRENVDKAVLQEAVGRAMRSFGYFRVVMRRGLFWFYLERTELEPQVRLESQRPCARIFFDHAKELLFDVSYYGTRINIEVFHAIADGTGALELLRAVVYHYLAAVHKDELPATLPPLDKASPPAHSVEDSFKRYYDPSLKKSPFKEKAYTISGTILPSNTVKIISARIPTSQILRLAKSKNTTVTAYLSALMICSIYTGLVPKRAANRTIAVNIPVDLRGHFDSETARNFFSVVEVGYNFQGGPADFNLVLERVAEQLAQRVTLEALSGRINYNMAVQKNVITGITPLFLKNLILRVAYHKAESATTCALSNLGRITMPEPFSPHIDSFHCLLNPTPIHRFKACLCSYREEFIINFTSCIEETRAHRNFLRHLSNQGLNITVTCNGGFDDETL